MEYKLDIRTLSAVTSAVSMMVSVIMVYVYLTQKTYDGFKYWVYAAIFLSLGMALLGMRGILPDLQTVIIANVSIALYFAMIPFGLNLFLDKQPQKWPYFTAIALFILLFMYFCYITPNLKVRIIILSLFFSVFLVYSAYCIHAYSHEIGIKKNMMLIYIFLLNAIFLFFRIGYTLFSEGNAPDFMKASSVQAISFIVAILGNIGTFVGLLVYNLQKVESDFLKSDRELKSLRGIIPICAHCKQIRDEKGYWNQLERYISEHSEAQFSHSICDKCAKKYFSDIDD